MKKIKQIIYICSVVLPIVDAIVGTIKGLKKGLRQAGNERFKEQEENIKRRL